MTVRFKQSFKQWKTRRDLKKKITEEIGLRESSNA